MNHIYLAVRPLPPEDEAEQLQGKLNKRFPAEENSAYIQRLCTGDRGPLPSRVSVPRLGALCLLAEMLDALSIPTRDLRLARDEHSRPFANLPEGPAPFDFNVSHSGAHVACAVLMGEGLIGLDVEEPLSRERAIPLIKRYCTEGELAMISADEGPAFTRLWTIREALAKQDGRGAPLRYDASRIPAGIDVLCYESADSGAYLSLAYPQVAAGTKITIMDLSLPLRSV